MKCPVLAAAVDTDRDAEEWLASPLTPRAWSRGYMLVWTTHPRASAGETIRHGRGRRVGFTLLEMILVLAVAALMMGVAASAMVRSGSDVARGRRGLADVVMHLRGARADAMVTRSSVVVVLGGDLSGSGRAPGVLVMRREGEAGGDGEEGAEGAVGDGWKPREIDLGNLEVVDASGFPAASVRVGFDSSGRSDARGWRFVERGGARRGRIAWLIVFDPVSGEARLAEGDGSVAGEARWGDGADDRASSREQDR